MYVAILNTLKEKSLGWLEEGQAWTKEESEICRRDLEDMLKTAAEVKGFKFTVEDIAKILVKDKSADSVPESETGSEAVPESKNDSEPEPEA